MNATHSFAQVYAHRRAAGRCVECQQPAAERLCGACSRRYRARIKDEKRALKYGREQAREAR
jgi:hypothetical protein